ncbi:hypothetical protein [Asaia sp. HN010]|uniref:hypothetical protein n=1 Tax=Asaia sp. HN010 TaxID=3081233 RepID=UPI003016B3BA
MDSQVIMMNVKRFRHLAEAYGGDLRRWPAEERHDASVLVSESSEAADILRNAQSVDFYVKGALTRLTPSDAKVSDAATRLEANVMSMIGEVEQIPVRKFRSSDLRSAGARSAENFKSLIGGWREHRLALCMLCATSCVTGLWFGLHPVNTDVDLSMLASLDSAFLGMML